MYYSPAAKEDSRAPGPDASSVSPNALSTGSLRVSGVGSGVPAAGVNPAAGTTGVGFRPSTIVEDLEAAERVCLINEIRALEELKCVAAAAQARAAAAFDASTRRAQARAGLKAEQLGRGVARNWPWRAGTLRITVPSCWAWPGS